MLDLCRPDLQLGSNHYSLPPQWLSNGSSSSYQAYRSCLGDKLTTFSEDVSRELIISYFHHVHPVLPILNANAFLELYSKKQTNRPETSLLLLKCIFFAGASVCHTISYLNHKLTCTASPGYYRRGSGILKSRGTEETCICSGEGEYHPLETSNDVLTSLQILYGTGLETDKETLIQCSLLMSFWYAAPDDPLGPWHWNGVAIGLCHSLGLHRKFKATPTHQAPFSETKQSLWRRIWWTCYVRETWLALSYGRPLRIDCEDCDAPVPSVEDILHEPDVVSRDIELLYLPAELEASARAYVEMIKLSLTLAKVLANHYRPGKDPSPADVKRDEENIRYNERCCDALSNSPYDRVQTRVYSVQLYVQ